MTRTEAKNPSIKNVQYRGIEDFLNCAPMFLFFYSMKLKLFRVTQNETPKMAQNVCLYSQVVIFFSEDAPIVSLHEKGVGSIGLTDAVIHLFTAVLQGIAAMLVSAALQSSSPAAPGGRVVYIYILHLLFSCGVAGDVDLTPIWEGVSQGNARIEGLSNLNQVFMRGIPYCCWVFGGRVHFSPSLPLLVFVKNISL